MKFEIVPVTPYQQNCSIIWCPETLSAAIVDPGGEMDKLLAAVERLGVTLEKIILTHCHLDHAGAVADLSEKLNLPIIGPEKEDLFWIESLPAQAQMMNFPPVRSFVPTQWLNHGDQIQVGNQTLDVLYTPGHTPGHVVFYHQPSQLAWVGDVIFQGSIGRSDFPRGDHDTLVRSIREVLFPLGDDVYFIPGHGPMSSFGQERATNPFVADKVFG